MLSEHARGVRGHKGEGAEHSAVRGFLRHDAAGSVAAGGSLVTPSWVRATGLWVVPPLTVALAMWIVLGNLVTAAYVSLMTLTLVVMIYFFWEIVERRASTKDGIVHEGDAQGRILVPVRCSEYIIERIPFEIEVNGVRMATIYRKNEIQIPLSPGPVKVSVRCKGSEKFAITENADEDLALYVWVDYEKVCPRIIGFNRNEIFDESHVKASYESRARSLIWIAISSLACGAGFVLLLLINLLGEL
ncbi:MAG: hypothetical protein LBS92_01040 [Candidatus Methanoplasma sp.]|jgi:hypothetical protein|nr:hypothetical protein [Candidatus Methanoplasma sp.]